MPNKVDIIIQKIKDRLPDWFDKSDSTLLHTIINVLSQAIAEISDKSEEAVKSLYLQNSVGEFLEYWGSWYGIERAADESDIEYAIRILVEITSPKQTIPALKYYISNVLNISENEICIYEPYKDLLILSETGNLSGSKKLTDPKYWNWTVIDIQVPYPYNDYVKYIIKRIKAGGIKAFWSYIIPESNEVFTGNYLQEFTTKEIFTRVTFFEPFGLSDDDGWLSVTGALSHVSLAQAFVEQIISDALLSGTGTNGAGTLDQELTTGYGNQAYGSTWYGAIYPDALTNVHNAYGTQPFGTTWYGGY